MRRAFDVSVIIPTRNRAALLERAIASILAQTVPVSQVIVVDDNSTDDTAQVIERLRDSRFAYVRHEVSKGGAAARNSGVGAATGDVIAFLDDDDTWLPQKVARDLFWLEHHDLVVTGVVRGGSGRPDLRGASRSITLDELRSGFPFGGGMSNMAAYADLVRAIPFDERLPCGQDWDFLIRAVGRANAIYAAEPLVIYNDAPHTRITNRAPHLDSIAIQERTLVVEKHRAMLGHGWYDFHRARITLSHLGVRHGRLSLILEAVSRFGLLPTIGVLGQKLRRMLAGPSYG